MPLTTRPMREGETEGVQYHFVSKETFEAHLAAAPRPGRGDPRGRGLAAHGPAHVRELRRWERGLAEAGFARMRC